MICDRCYQPLDVGELRAVVAPVVPTAIGKLLLHRCPSAIVFAIAEAAINAVNRVSVWALAHIGKEVVEYEPFSAYPNAASAVFAEVFYTRFCATTNHRAPRTVGWRFPLVGPMAVATIAKALLARFLGANASAIGALALANIASADRLDDAAIALTEVRDTISESLAFTENRQHGESFADRDRQFSHNRLYPVY